MLTFKYVSDPIVTHVKAAVTAVDVSVLVALDVCDVVTELLADVVAEDDAELVSELVAVEVAVVETDCPGISCSIVDSTKPTADQCAM